MKSSSTINEILIVGIVPYFLERRPSWYSQNYAKIKNAARSQIWWKDNTLFLEKDLNVKLYEILRRIVDFGYNKVQTVGAPGEFAQRGGILDIFPINSEQAYRVEFSGNRISQIALLPIKILKSEKTIQKELRRRQPEELLYNLKLGDYLVHLDHGIGMFSGFAQRPGGEISTQTPNERSHDKFFVIEYAKKDRLYVPLDLEKKLSRYIGFEQPIVHRLGGTLWFKTKRHAKESALELAKQLLELYAKRALARGFQYPPDEESQKELESDFPYVETDDQAKAIAQVKKDMESEKPMDRLICGDVGFGKTEVALRAAFKAVAGGKQIALLAPTTILANQHFQTFWQRLKKFPVEVGLLTRLQTKTQQKKIIKAVAERKIDILIGTHRILSSDVQFKNLGLAIIDEEQRFGVRQKEKFKSWRNNVDVLSLSATPIPRTLHLTLSGLRDISIINTPPPGRLAIKTFIQPFSQKIIEEAIEQELKRDGQVYYLHNRVETIELAAQQIKKLAPNAKIVTIHGRLPEKKLISIMNDFGDGKINVLVATIIIENGLDFPNVNTLIVANAARLGLAQAYQIRGRIGRSHQQAFAYFLYNVKSRPQAHETYHLPGYLNACGRDGIPHRRPRALSIEKGPSGAWTKHLTAEAEQRLAALKEAEALGSGYQIALRDLEIRGAGNILGHEQSGPINVVGLNLYMQILNETIEELKTDP